MKELAQAVGRAKAVIDNGLCRVGPRLSPDDVQAAVLTGSASRALALSDAVVGLCGRDHPGEALALVRQLAETAVELRWVAADPARAPEAAAALEAPAWAGAWPEPRFKERALAAGVPERDVSETLAFAADFLAGNRTGAPWSHVFAVNNRPAPEAARVLALTVRLIGHVVSGLETRWPGAFPGAEELSAS